MKDIYELLNETKIDFSEVTEAQVSEIEREKGKRKLMQSIKRKNKSKKIVATAAAAVLIVLTSMTAIKPTWAKNIPIVGDLFQKDLVSTNNNYIYYTKAIGKTKSQHGIDITLENAAVDNNMLSLSFTVKNNNAAIEDPQRFYIPMTLKLNGKDMTSLGGTDHSKVVDKNTVQYLFNISLDSKNLPEELNLDVVIDCMFNKKGDWGTKFSIDTKEIKKNTHVEKVNDKFNIAGKTFTVDEVTISPLTTNIKYHDEGKNDRFVDFLVLDQDGNELKLIGAKDSGMDNKNLSSISFLNNKNISSLKLIPRYFDGVNAIVDSKEVDLDKFSQFKLKISDKAEIDIEDLKVEGEYLIVKYKNKYEGKRIFAWGKDIEIKVKGTSLKAVDPIDLGKEYDNKDANTLIYKIGDARTVKIEGYDNMVKDLYEDKAITVKNR